MDGAEPGQVCPHNAYLNNPDVFANRDAVSGTIERLLRLVGSADLGILAETEMDPLSVTELLTSKTELTRQENLRQKQAYDRARLEAEMNNDRAKLRPM